MIKTKLLIGHFYKKYLNLYGDNGNVEILVYRAKQRGIDVDVVEIDNAVFPDPQVLKDINLVFMGGGPDSGQKEMYEDLVENKASFLRDYVEGGGVGLYVCGSYQLLGNYYKSADGFKLKGSGIFDIYTEHFGNQKPRCIGNVTARIASVILEDPVFVSVNKLDDVVVGFENHGGRTYLGENTEPFARVIHGEGNNGTDFTEGVLYKNSIGTYLHGPILARNSHLADYLIAKSLKLDNMGPIDDAFTTSAHNCSINLK